MKYPRETLQLIFDSLPPTSTLTLVCENRESAEKLRFALYTFRKTRDLPVVEISLDGANVEVRRQESLIVGILTEEET